MELVAFGLYDANQWHVVNLRIIGGKIRHEKKYHLSAFVLASWVHTGITKFGREKEAKKG